MASKIKTIIAIALISVIPTLLIWLPFFLRIPRVLGIPLPREGMATIVANYDGPLFLVVAKTFYNPELMGNFEFGLPAQYYAAHFPLFPALIKLFSPLIGYVYSMLFLTVTISILAIYFFYLFIQDYVEKKNTLWLTAVFAVFPARFSKVSSSFDFKKISSITLIPFALLGVFILYKVRLNDFLAYFHSGDNIHLFFPPFQIFDYSQPWVGTFWLEEIIFVYLFGLLGLIKLIEMKERELAWFVGLFFASILFVSHRDHIRYSLPIVPFLLMAFSDTIIKKEFKYVMLILIIPIYLFSLAYISQNVMPISDWSPLL